MTKDIKELLDEVLRLSREVETIKTRLAAQEALLAEGAEIVEALTRKSPGDLWGSYLNKVAVWRDKAKVAR